MKNFRVNFKDKPTPKNAISVAFCDSKKNNGLTVHKVEAFSSLTEFEKFLEQKEPWFAVLNFPLTQPKQFLEKMTLSHVWNHSIKEIHKWKQTGFEKKVKQYTKKLSKGVKTPLRITDIFAGAESPLKTTGSLKFPAPFCNIYLHKHSSPLKIGF